MLGKAWLRSAVVGSLGVAALAVGAPQAVGAGGSSVAPGQTASWDFAAVAGAALGGTPIESACPPVECDAHDLQIAIPSGYYPGRGTVLKVKVSWTSTATTDLDVFAFDPAGNEVAGPGSPDTQGTGDNAEVLEIHNPVPGTWSIRVDGIAPSPTASHAVATLLPGPGLARQSPARLPAAAPRFDNYDFPTSYQSRDAAQRPNAGEPSIGTDLATGAVMYGVGTQYTRINFDDSTRPARATFTDVTAPEMKVVSEDTILHTDEVTHRTWALNFDLAGSQTTYSDDDGATWSRTFSTCATNGTVPTGLSLCGPDHETLGSGPYHQPAPAHTYPRAVYYCAQQIVADAQCGLSTDGGVTYGPGVNLWNGHCSPLHGHVRVGPTGVAYVPNTKCQDAKGTPRAGVAVSEDNGVTWTFRAVPDSGAGTSDPSVAEGPDGTLYFGYQSGDGHPKVATSRDHGRTWAPSVDVGRFSGGSTEDGLPYGVQNTEFSEVIPGDPGRAAFAFLGTGTPGNAQGADFPGVWYLFVSYTYDGGKHWQTVNATPNDPVQRGCVWNAGGSNPCRNMLDFNDITVDALGRVLVAYTDGCTKGATYDCVHDKTTYRSCTLPSQVRPFTSETSCSYGKLSAVVRQWCGRGLRSRYDAVLVARCPHAVVKPVHHTKRVTRHRRRLPRTGWVVVPPVVMGAAALGRRRRRG